MLNTVLTIFLMASKVASDPVCDEDVGSQSCDDKPKSIFQSQKSEYIPGVQGNYEPRTDSDSDHGEGPGAGGQPVHLSGSASDMLKYGMSETVSDLISLSRKVPDTRVTGKITKQKDYIQYILVSVFILESWLSPLALSQPAPQGQCCAGVPQ